MVVSVLVSIVSAGILAVPGLAFTGHVPLSQSVWLFALLPVVIVFLIPPVLNRVIAFALRLARRPPLEHPLSGAGILKSTLYALLGWLISGTVVWLIAVQLGMPASVPSFLLAAGGYSLSWAIGFIVFFMPAGLGVREVVLAAMLAGFLGPGELIVVVLLARVLSTVADVVLGLGSFALRDRPAKDEADWRPACIESQVCLRPSRRVMLGLQPSCAAAALTSSQFVGASKPRCSS